jgi:hypothetical protein
VLVSSQNTLQTYFSNNLALKTLQPEYVLQLSCITEPNVSLDLLHMEKIKDISPTITASEVPVDLFGEEFLLYLNEQGAIRELNQ